MPNDKENDLFSKAVLGRAERAMRGRKRSTTILVLKFYSVMGAFTAIFGLIYAVFRAYNINLSPEVTMGLLIAVSGVFLSAGSLFMVRYIRARDSSLEEMESEEISQMFLLRQWANFESSARTALGMDLNSPKSFSIRNMLNELRSSNLISEEDYVTVRVALEMRNKVAHGLATENSFEEIELVSNALRKVSKKITKENV